MKQFILINNDTGKVAAIVKRANLENIQEVLDSKKELSEEEYNKVHNSKEVIDNFTKQ